MYAIFALLEIATRLAINAKSRRIFDLLAFMDVVSHATDCRARHHRVPFGQFLFYTFPICCTGLLVVERISWRSFEGRIAKIS